MIYSIYGFGKGKTETAIGMAIRAIANNEKVLYIQFMKDGTSGEVNILEGLGAITDCSGFEGVAMPTTEDAQIERKLLESVKHRQLGDKFDLIILDEVLVCVDTGLISYIDLKEFLDNIGCDICMTGRVRSHDIRKKIAALSDVCSNNFSVKHSFNTYCKECNQEYKYHYKHCPQCGIRLSISEPARKGRDF